jgi:nicotinamide mononucleotide transporter
MHFSEFKDALTQAIMGTSALELVAVLLALIYVVLASRQNVFCWLAGLLSVAIYTYICYESKLYLETFLQIFYLVISVYGWYQWVHGSADKKELPVSSYSFKKLIPLIVAGFIFAMIAGYFFDHYTTAVLPYLDAFVTVFSIIATWMTAKKILQSWIFWIVIDLAAMILYGQRGLVLSGVLYFIYVVICFYGLSQWKKSTSIA